MPVNTTDQVPFYDIAVIGAGFSGCKVIYEARKRNFSCHVFEASDDLGGTWRNNRYPGARVDSNTPLYQLDIPEVYKTFRFKEKYPGQAELLEYFEHVDNVLHVRKDMTFHTFITEASFDKEAGIWRLWDSHGKEVSRSKFFLPCIGFAAKKYTPEFEGFEDYQGKVVHSSDWPEGLDLSNKTVGLIGTGATGVQVIQETAPIAKELFVYQRTPNLALPMRQSKNPEQPVENYPKIFHDRSYCPSGHNIWSIGNSTKAVSKGEREKAYAEMFKKGGFWFLVSNYADMMIDQESNDIAYAYWRDQTRKRISKDLWEDLAPTVAPHPLGAKRASLEQNYYEQFARSNVHLKNIKKNPIKRFYEKGIELEDGSKQEFEVIIFATGFDAVTGSFKNIKLKNVHNGKNLSDIWDEDGCATYMGISIHGYPNMYFTYGPQAPTAFTNGPSTLEKQVDWILDVIEYINKNGLKYLDAKEEGQVKYTETINKHTDNTLYTKAKSWYMGANIPGKKVQMLNWIAGVDKYSEMLDASAKLNYPGFEQY